MSTPDPLAALLALVREAAREGARHGVTETLAESRAPSATEPLVDARELARLLAVSPATVRRLTAEGAPHTFVGQSTRYAPDEVRAWLAERGRRGTTAVPSKSAKTTIAGVRLLSRRRR